MVKQLFCIRSVLCYVAFYFYYKYTLFLLLFITVCLCLILAVRARYTFISNAYHPDDPCRKKCVHDHVDMKNVHTDSAHSDVTQGCTHNEEGFEV